MKNLERFTGIINEFYLIGYQYEEIIYFIDLLHSYKFLRHIDYDILIGFANTLYSKIDCEGVLDDVE